VEADYLSPARFDDLLDVETEPLAVTAARLMLRQTVLRDGLALFEATVTLVALGPDGGPRRLPADLRGLLPNAPKARALR
jgi:acyl-CoA thioester hydrolase